MATPAVYNPISKPDAPDVAPTSLGAWYTAPTGGTNRGVRIGHLRVTNITTSVVTLQITVTESGGGAGSNKAEAWNARILPNGKPYYFLIGEYLDPGDVIGVQAGTASALAVKLVGWEMTD